MHKVDLPFDWFGYSSVAYVKINNVFTCTVDFKPDKQNISYMMILSLTFIKLAQSINLITFN